MIVLVVLFVSISSAFASATFNFHFPDHYMGSLQIDNDTIMAGQNTNPYVHTNQTTISTVYLLVPSGDTMQPATNPRYITTWGTKYFTWKPNYGGSGTYYKLVAHPDVYNGTWNAYNVDGYWDVN